MVVQCGANQASLRWWRPSRRSARRRLLLRLRLRVCQRRQAHEVLLQPFLVPAKRFREVRVDAG